MMAASLGTFGRIWSATARHWVLAASGVSWANAVAMKAETTRRPLLPACASAFLMKWTLCRHRHKVHYADVRIMPTMVWNPAFCGGDRCDEVGIITTA